MSLSQVLNKTPADVEWADVAFNTIDVKTLNVTTLAVTNLTVNNDLEVKNDAKVDADFEVVGTSVLGVVNADDISFGVAPQTSLSYYEELTSTTSTVSSTIWTGTRPCTWKLTRIGRTVFLNLENVSSIADNVVPGKILHDEPIPARFLPVGVYPVQLIAVNNSTAIGSETTGDCEISVALGIIAIGSTPGGGNFSGVVADVSGFRQFSMSWQI